MRSAPHWSTRSSWHTPTDRDTSHELAWQPTPPFRAASPSRPRAALIPRTARGRQPPSTEITQAPPRGSTMTSRHILITGGAGFIGTHLCAALLDRGDRVTALDNLS